MLLCWSVSFRILTSLSLRCLQRVSAPGSGVSCFDKSLPLLSPGSKYLSWSTSLCILISAFLCCFQDVSMLCSISFLLHHDKPIPLSFPESECPSRSLTFRDLTGSSLCSLQEVSVVYELSFYVLTCPSLCAPQRVSAPCELTLFPFYHKSLPWYSSVCESSFISFFCFADMPCALSLQKVRFLFVFPFFHFSYHFPRVCRWYSTSWPHFTLMYCPYFSVLFDCIDGCLTFSLNFIYPMITQIIP